MNSFKNKILSCIFLFSFLFTTIGYTETKAAKFVYYDSCLNGSWYEDTLHERSRFRDYFYRINDHQLTVVDKTNNKKETYFYCDIKNNHITIKSLGEKSKKIQPGEYEIIITDENHFTILFNKPVSYVRNSFSKQQAIETRDTAANVSLTAVVVGATSGLVLTTAGTVTRSEESEWYARQKLCRDAERKGLANLSSAEKGNYGEIKTDIFMHEHGYERVSKTTVTDLSKKSPQGIDGVYYNAKGKPQYVIAEAKCGYQNEFGEFIGKKSLSSPADGIEMSEDWILGTVTGNNRLEKAVGKELADKIFYESGFEKIIVHVDNQTGKCNAYLLDNLADDVNIVGAW